jgi:hypothetical protein
VESSIYFSTNLGKIIKRRDIAKNYLRNRN